MSRRLEWIFNLKRYTLAHGQKPKITNNQRNANQNHNEFSPYIFHLASCDCHHILDQEKLTLRGYKHFIHHNVVKLVYQLQEEKSKGCGDVKQQKPKPNKNNNNNGSMKKSKNKSERKYLETNENKNATFQNLWNSAKAVLKGKFRAIQACLKKQENLQIKILTSHLK